MKPAVGWRKEIATNELGLRQTRRPFRAFLAFRMREWGNQRVADRRPLTLTFRQPRELPTG